MSESRYEVRDVLWGLSVAGQDRTIAAIKDSGAAWTRINYSWAALEPNKKGEINTTNLAAPTVNVAFQYMLRDKGTADDWASRLGLLRRDWSARPALAAFKDFT